MSLSGLDGRILPVLPGFTIPSGLDEHAGSALLPHIDRAVKRLERGTGRRLGDGAHPLLLRVVPEVSCTSSALLPRPYRSGAGSRDKLLRELSAAVADAASLRAGESSAWGATVHALPEAPRGGELTWIVFQSTHPMTGVRSSAGELVDSPDSRPIRLGHESVRTVQSLRSSALIRKLGRIAGAIQAEAEPVELEIVLGAAGPEIAGVRRSTWTAATAARLAVGMVRRHAWTQEHAVARFSVARLEELVRPVPRPGELARLPILRIGTPVSSGVSSGLAVFSAKEALELRGSGRRPILLADRATPEDVLAVSPGGAIAVSAGGLFSAAAAAARELGIPMVARTAELEPCERFTRITVLGGRGEVRSGEPRLVRPVPGGAARTLLGWAGRACMGRGFSIRANADSAAEVHLAARHGARGVGLCRTERMLDTTRKLRDLRCCVLAPETEAGGRALKRLEAAYRRELTATFRAAKGEAVCVRLLDPSLGELLPDDETEVREIAAETGLESERISAQVRGFRGVNPALGYRGSRVGLTYPRVYEAQVRALIEAACTVKLGGVAVLPEIMFPMVSAPGELRELRARSESTIRSVLMRRGVEIDYRIGAMVEVPRAALLAGTLAPYADFLSFGTNDLTQAVFGLSREDAGELIELYVSRGLWTADPFRRLDRAVWELVRIAASRARAARSGIRLGVCGEHAADPESIRLMLVDAAPAERIDYLSAAPHRDPTTLLAAAQALLGTALP